MWKTLSKSGRALTRLNDMQKRTFLSESYRCTDAWNKRLETPLLSKIKANDMFHELDQKFQNSGKASAVDVDIYANVLNDAEHSDELLDILHKLRLTPEATNILDSTHHAVIRYLLDNNEINDLLTVLHDRINYGIFPDHLCYNILMDTLVKKQDFSAAAKIAVLPMLQEDSTNPISNALALYCCHKYLENPEGWKAPEPEPKEDPRAEVIKIRVHFIRNPYFDDHFDLQDPKHLVGKTMVFYGKTMNDVAGRSCHLRGLVLWKKYKQASSLIKEWIKNGQKDCIYGNVLTQIQEDIAGIPEGEINDQVNKFKGLLEEFDKNSLKDGCILEDIENRVRKAVEAQAETDISDACKNYKEWEETRVSVLEAQLAELDKKERLEKIDEMKKELHSRERLLTYFENRKHIDWQISEKRRMEKEKYGKRRKMSQDIDDNYIPPEIVKKRNH